MDHILDLDQAAAVLAARIPRWTTAGIQAGPITWRDQLSSWPHPLLTERSLVHDPDSVGILLSRDLPAAELQICLFRGGWADVDYYSLPNAEGGPLPANEITSADDFAERLDAWVSTAFGA